MTMTIRTRRILAVIGAACAIGPVLWSIAFDTPPKWAIAICGFVVVGIGIADRQIDPPPDPEEP